LVQCYRLQPVQARPRILPAETQTGPLNTVIEQAASRYGFDPKPLWSVIQVESAGNPQAVSPKGAKGLMQLMPATVRELGVKDPFNPRDSRYSPPHESNAR
jgi:soluble lytic murein transglycosylase-like protein